jgi:hypothetical protein
MHSDSNRKLYTVTAVVLTLFGWQAKIFKLLTFDGQHIFCWRAIFWPLHASSRRTDYLFSLFSNFCDSGELLFPVFRYGDRSFALFHYVLIALRGLILLLQLLFFGALAKLLSCGSI